MNEITFQADVFFALIISYISKNKKFTKLKEEKCMASVQNSLDDNSSAIVVHLAADDRMLSPQGRNILHGI